MTNCALKLVNPETFKVSDEGDLGFFINGKLQTTYHLNHIPTNSRIIERMLSTAFEEGKRERSRELKKLIY